MAWSQARKAQGRAELQSRLAYQTSVTRRTAFLKATSAVVFLPILAVLAFRTFRTGENHLFRIEGIVTLCVCFAGLIFAAPLAYVRYLDWRRGTKP